MAAKLEDGNVRAAVRILILAESPAFHSGASLSKLREKKPSLWKSRQFPCPTTGQLFVGRRIRGPSGSSHLSSRLCWGPRFSAPTVYTCTRLDDVPGIRSRFPHFFDGFCQSGLVRTLPFRGGPIFFGGHLLAMNKKSGGIRPIAVGFSLRRLASKCANSFDINRLRQYFYPNQLGVGTPGGCEAAIHSARRYLEG